MKTKSSYIGYWEIRQKVISAVINGLNGKPFDWGYSSGATDAWMGIAKGLGMNLISMTAAKKLGLELKRGQHPVGRIKYGAPINKVVDVYVQECQFNPKPSKVK